MAGEEERGARRLRGLGGGERALLVLAPRHPERWDEVARLLAARVARRSPSGTAPQTATARRRASGTARRSCCSTVSASSRRSTASPPALHRRHPGADRRPQPAGAGALRRADRRRPLDAQLPRHGGAVRPRRRLAAGRRRGRLAAAWRAVARRRPPPLASIGERALRSLEANRGALERTLAMLAPVLARVEAIRDRLLARARLVGGAKDRGGPARARPNRSTAAVESGSRPTPVIAPPPRARPGSSSTAAHRRLRRALVPHARRAPAACRW